MVDARKYIRVAYNRSPVESGTIGVRLELRESRPIKMITTAMQE
jgi:hypothetical protein